MDFLGVRFLSDLPTQIPDSSVVYSGHTFGIVPPLIAIILRRENNERLSGRFPRASALVAVNCGLAVLAFTVRPSRPPDGISRFQTTFR
jgi:hypothetical protein